MAEAELISSTELHEGGGEVRRRVCRRRAVPSQPPRSRARPPPRACRGQHGARKSGEREYQQAPNRPDRGRPRRPSRVSAIALACHRARGGSAPAATGRDISPIAWGSIGVDFRREERPPPRRSSSQRPRQYDSKTSSERRWRSHVAKAEAPGLAPGPAPAPRSSAAARPTTGIEHARLTLALTTFHRVDRLCDLDAPARASRFRPATAFRTRRPDRRQDAMRECLRAPRASAIASASCAYCSSPGRAIDAARRGSWASTNAFERDGGRSCTSSSACCERASELSARRCPTTRGHSPRPRPPSPVPLPR